MVHWSNTSHVHYAKTRPGKPTILPNPVRADFRAAKREGVLRIAAENSSDADEYIQQLVERYVDHDAWFREQVKKGMDQLDRGEFFRHEEIGARIEKMFRS